MGRNKIDIKPLEDGRNRTVTFTKRKAGLFKKAHELAILCSVDISVIIIGRNKKIYEYCSNDSNEILNLYQSDQMNMFESKNPKDYGDYESKSRIPSFKGVHGNNRHISSNSLNSLGERHHIDNQHTRTVSDTTQLRKRTRSSRNNPIREVNDTIEESQISYDNMEDADNFEDEEESNDGDDSDVESNDVEEDIKTEDRNLSLGSKRHIPFQTNGHVNKIIKLDKRSPLDVRIPPIEPHTPEPSSTQYFNEQTPTLTPYKPLSSLKKSSNSKRPTLSLQIPHNGADDSLFRSNQSTITAGNSSNKSNQSVIDKNNEKQDNDNNGVVDNNKGNNLNVSIISNRSENSSNNNDSITTLNMINMKNNENIHTTLPSPKDILSGINIKNQLNMLTNNRGRSNLNDDSSTPLTSALRKAFTPTTTNFLNNFSINNNALETPLGGGFNFTAMSPQLTTPAIGFPTLQNHVQHDSQQPQSQQQSVLQQNQLNHPKNPNGLMMGHSLHNNQQQSETQHQNQNQDLKNRGHMINLTPINRNSATSTFYPPFPNNLQRGISYMSGIGTIGMNNNSNNNFGNINGSNSSLNMSELPRAGEMPSKYLDSKTPDTSLFPTEWTMNTGLTPVFQIRPTFPIIRNTAGNSNDKATNEDETSLRDTSSSASSKN